jgi:hypothetical protein
VLVSAERTVDLKIYARKVSSGRIITSFMKLLQKGAKTLMITKRISEELENFADFCLINTRVPSFLSFLFIFAD